MATRKKSITYTTPVDTIDNRPKDFITKRNERVKRNRETARKYPPGISHLKVFYDTVKDIYEDNKGTSKQTEGRIKKKNGGGIYIKPENRGKFTATMKRTGKSAEELSHSPNPLTRKRAIFALNARKWNH